VFGGGERVGGGRLGGKRWVGVHGHCSVNDISTRKTHLKEPLIEGEVRMDQGQGESAEGRKGKENQIKSSSNAPTEDRILLTLNIEAADLKGLLSDLKKKQKLTGEGGGSEADGVNGSSDFTEVSWGTDGGKDQSSRKEVFKGGE